MRNKFAALLGAPVLATGMLIPLASGTAHAATTYSGTATDDAGVAVDGVADDLGLTMCAGKNPNGAVESLTAPEATLSPTFFPSGSTANCGKTITITVGGKSTMATVVDECAGCATNGIDLTPSAFSQIAGPGNGDTRVVTWSFD